MLQSQKIGRKTLMFGPVSWISPVGYYHEVEEENNISSWSLIVFILALLSFLFPPLASFFNLLFVL